jgi:hypothetical protein
MTMTILRPVLPLPLFLCLGVGNRGPEMPSAAYRHEQWLGVSSMSSG